MNAMQHERVKAKRTSKVDRADEVKRKTNRRRKEIEVAIRTFGYVLYET